MRNFIKQNTWFLVGLIFAVFFSFLLVYGLGFWKMVQSTSPLTERLRDVTFPIWDRYSFAEHGYLVFYSMRDFEGGVAYSNHSSMFLFFLYSLYKLEMIFPKLPMRAMAANFEMLSCVAAILYVALYERKEKIKLHQGLLILLGVVFFLTMPTFWISAAKFNVDNPFHFQFPMLIWVAFRLSKGDVSGVKLWVPLGLLCVAAPLAAPLLGVYLVVSSIRGDGLSKDVLKLGLVTIFVSVIFYMQPVVTSKILGFSSSNSGWRFRSGLDGDVSYFTNVLNSVIDPYFSRPVYLLALPIGLLLVQLVNMAVESRWCNRVAMTNSGQPRLFYGVIFSQYMIVCLLWPQAVSIHPYLYDYMLLAPISVFIIFNLARSEILFRNAQVWIWVMLFFVSFNLQQIAQAKQCSGCYYPSWASQQ